jgi:1,4-alpha-glucan branching enzyme
MKKIYFLMALALLWVTGAMAQTSDITFRVDMRGYTGAAYTTVNVNGTFNGWCGGCNAMSDANNDSIWEVTLPLAAGAIEYKFTVDGWTGQENLMQGTPCTVTNSGFTNRAYTVAGNAVLDAVCWNSCNTCSSPPTTYNVTFQVDLNGYTGAPYTTVNLNGTFNGWCGGCAVMTDANNDSIYELTLPLPAMAIEYKFTLDGSSSNAIWEQLTAGSSCTVTNGGFTNRGYTVAANATLPAVCWQSCNVCSAPPPPTFATTFAVDMRGYTGAAFSTVNINGSFNGWCGSCNTMTDANNDSIYEITLPLLAGAIEYKFTVDGFNGQENLTAGSACTQTTGAFTNRVYNVTAASSVGAVCWNSCVACAPPTYPVTFKVDMRGYTGATFATVNVNGTFNGWCGGCNALTDANNDSIWEVTLPLPAGPIEYKFTVDGWNGQENLTPGTTCTQTIGGFTNRVYTVTSAGGVLTAVCWNSCNTCSTPAPTPVNVTFVVDMRGYSGSAFTTVNINGSFNGWCGGCNAMTDANNDSIWEVTLPLLPGTIEYKFTVDGWTGQENLTPGSSCTVTNFGFTNRVLTFTTATTLPSVCWNSCTACTGAPTSANITFRVNMSQYSGPSYTTVNLNGSFNNWCGGCAVMTDPDNDGIFELMVNVSTAAPIEWKYTLDGWNGQENLTPGGACTQTIGQFTNRWLQPTVSTVLPAVCWESCTACPSLGSVTGLVRYGNNAQTALNNSTVLLKNALGATVATATSGSNGSFSMNNVVPGSYTLEATTTKPWGGVTASDALLAVRHATGAVLQTGLRLVACDVNGNAAVNSGDALLINRRFSGTITTFSVGSWYFEQPAVTVTSGALTQNISAICYGDVNASYSPVARGDAGLVLVADQATAHHGALPLALDRDLGLGSMSLELNVPAGVRVTGVRSLVGGDLSWHTANGRLRLGWFSAEEVAVQAGQVAFVLETEITRNNDVAGHEWTLGSVAEATDAWAVNHPQVGLRIPALAAPKAVAFVAPQPVNQGENIRLVLNLDRAATLQVEVRDMLGRSVSSLRQVSAGAGAGELNLEGLSTGRYSILVHWLDGSNQRMNLPLLVR